MSDLANFVWSIADQLRGPYRPNQYGDVILPMTILRRLACTLEPTHEQVLKLAEKEDRPERLDVQVKRQLGLSFYNTSPWTFAKLLGDPDGLAANLIDYLAGFSASIDVFERFKFESTIHDLAEKNRLLLIVQRFADIDLSPATISNAAMGDLFEELIRKFADASNETAGEHFTPRDAIRLVVDLLFTDDDKALAVSGVVRSVYDPTVGTGGMLSIADEHLHSRNPSARLRLYGQEHNDQSYAICKSDMIAKGQDAENIKLGDTLANDLLDGTTFDYCLSNPPYGVEWSASQAAVKQDRTERGAASRFHAGLPSISDGQMLFLQHIVAKMRPPKDGGGRAGIVLNGSPLFSGAAGSGPSDIRKWLLEADLVDAIVALPSHMFYNTGIPTYVWILDNNKPAARVGKVQLIDGSQFFVKMRKSLGSKTREMSQADRDRVVEIYSAYAKQSPANTEHSKIFQTTDFGYWSITVERPLRLNFEVTPERIESVMRLADADKGPLTLLDQDRLREVLEAFGAVSEGRRWMDRALFLPELRKHLRAAAMTLAPAALRALWLALSERDAAAEICRDSKGNPEPDPALRDSENVPFAWSRPGSIRDSRYGAEHCDVVINDFFAHEVTPFVADAWIDRTKTREGYEIPFTRHFYTYDPPRELEAIDNDLEVLVKDIIDLLREVEG